MKSSSVDRGTDDHQGARADYVTDAMQVFAATKARRGEARRLPGTIARAARLVAAASPTMMWALAASQVVTMLALFSVVLLSKRALDVLILTEANRDVTSELLTVLLGLAVIAGAASVSSALQSQQQRLVGEQVGRVVWDRLLSVTTVVPLDWYEHPEFYNRLRRVQDNSMSRPQLVVTSFITLLGGVAGATALAVALATLDPLLLPLMLLAGFPVLWLNRLSSSGEFTFALKQAPLLRQRHYLRELLTDRAAAKEIRAMGSETALVDEHGLLSEKIVRALRRQVRKRQAVAALSAAIMATTVGATFLLLAWALSSGRMQVGDVAAAIVGVRLLSSRLDAVLKGVGTLLESSLFLDDLDEFLALAPPAELPVRSQSSAARAPLRQGIQLDNVSYRYPSSEREAVADVSLTIRAGEVVALVGENGSGKTTVAKLIASLFLPTSGDVLWDGEPISQHQLAKRRASVAVIFQDFLKYKFSALRNIGIGEPETMDDFDAAVEAGRRAQADRFLKDLPNGYSTILSSEFSGGSDLSLGQWQRVALARAMRRSAELFVLDEPSSALDPRAERELFDDVRQLIGQKAALLISHRFSSARHADRIYVMEAGRIVEQGTHDELMMRDGVYAELFTMQARGYATDPT